MVVWLSGGSSGLGRYLTEALLEKGDTVIAGARGFAGETKGRLHCLQLDVTNAESVQAFIEKALPIAQPDVLINAAGIMRFGSMEDIPLCEVQAVLDVNVLGTLRMTQGFLKHRDTEKRGLIVNFSSINGLLSTPFQGAYSLSKHALEGMSEALQMELRGQNVDVMVVEPGDHRGGSEKHRVFCKNTSEKYKALLDRATGRIREDENNGSSPLRFAKRLANKIHAKKRPFRLRIAKMDQHLAVFLHDALPGGLFLKIIGDYYLKGE